MIQFGDFYRDRAAGVRQGLFGLPSWARFMVGIAALPGIVLVGLSIVAFLVSLLALLLLTLPVYRLLQTLTSHPSESAAQPHRPGAKRVEVTVVSDRPV
jgi:hypothetical protein